MVGREGIQVLPVQLISERLEKRYADTFTLGPLSVDIGSGVTCIVGPNGAGKSTLFRLAAGVDRPSSGTIRIVGDGRATLGYLPQDPLLPGTATCEEFLTYVAWLQRIPRRDRPDAVEQALVATGLQDRRRQRIAKLSGGMARRLGIAHALIHDPALLLLDEPTAGLDPRQRVALRQTIASMGDERIILVATHLVEDIRGLASRVIVLNRGRIVFDGDTAELERAARPEMPGDSDLERAIATLMGDGE